ncbi:MAG: imidazole glycerol phosphate synthase subunit HisH [Chitinispirillia bacterium]|jgi:glutamine amidotransferase
MVVIIDYDAGNVTSVKRALDYLNVTSEITRDRNKILNAERIIIPGVGHAGSAMNVMKKHNIDQLLHEAFNRAIPILGICLGSQIILSHSDEADTKCLDLIKGNCFKFNFSNPDLKIPHMGWNTIQIKRQHSLFNGIKENSEVYFVHSYYPQPDNSDSVYAVSDYEIKFPAAIGHKNLFATQFHPEKSGPIGLQILKNFSKWDSTLC